MAGAKETPRQKMINLMYLVLLAMLALQVSSAIIQKFHFLNESMELANAESNLKNDELMSRMKFAVEKAKNNPKDVKVLDAATEMRDATSEMRSFIRELKKDMIEETGGIDENGNYAGAKEEEKVAVMMLGPGDTKKGKGYELKKRLNDYAQSIGVLMKKNGVTLNLDPLALDGKEDPIFKDDPEQKNKDFAQLNFEATPMIAALAVLTEKEANINAIETQALSLLKEKITGRVIPIDRVRPVVTSNTSRVVAGTEYEADMFMAAYASSYKPKMTMNSRDLDVNDMGAGKVKFKAGATNYVDGLAKKTWKGTITYPKAGGGDSVYTVEQEYYVVEPVIRAQSAVKPTLFKGCANELTIDVPALAADYDPQFSATGARIIPTQEKGKIKVVPNSPQVSIRVKNRGTDIGKVDYDVKLIPKPTLEIRVGGNKKPNVLQGDSKSDVSRAKIVLKPNEEFKKTNPLDARYRIKKWKVMHIGAGNRPQGNPVTGSDQLSDLRRLLADANSGDRILIEVLEIQRKDFRGDVHDVQLGERDRVFNLIVR